MLEMTTPGPMSARELKAVVEAERAGSPFLLFRDGAGEQQLLVLGDSPNWLALGRSPEADVMLDWDDQVSAVHAELHRAGGEWTVSDDGLSRNGTFLNGARLNGRHRLRDGDCLRLGQTALLYRKAGVAAGTSGTAAALDTPTVDRLSETQRRVLVALCRPYRDGDRFAMPATNQQIGAEVCLGLDAVKTHLRVLFGKFGLDHLPQNEKRIRLAERVLEWGFVRRSDL
jgi:hypothetical protein